MWCLNFVVQVPDNKTPQITKGQCLKSWAEFFWTKFNMKLPGILDWPLVNPKSFEHRRSQASRAEQTPPIKIYSKQNNPYYISLYHINYINKTYFTESTFNFQPWVLLIQTTQRNPFCAFPVASFKSFALGLIRNPRNRPLPVRGNLPWFPIQWRIFHHTTQLKTSWVALNKWPQSTKLHSYLWFSDETFPFFWVKKKPTDPDNLQGLSLKISTTLAGLNSERKLIGSYLVVEQPILRKQQQKTKSSRMISPKGLVERDPFVSPFWNPTSSTGSQIHLWFCL